MIQRGSAGVERTMQAAEQSIAWAPRAPGLAALFVGSEVNMRRRGPTMPEAAPGVRNGEPERLIEAIAERRDRAAFAALFDLYAPRIKTWMIRTGLAADLAEDIAQEALLSVWRHATSYDRAKASASAWIFAIARNRRIDHLRRDQRQRRSPIHDVVEEQAADDVIAELDSLERDQRVRDALKTLPEEQMRVVELSFFLGKPHGDIAKLLDIPLGTVKSRLRLAFEKLRSNLDSKSNGS